MSFGFDCDWLKVLPNGEWERTDTYLRLVTRDSAACFCPREAIHHQIPIDTDHSNLVKFQGHDDPYYEMVRSKIEELVKEAPGIINKRREICM
jgi:hypothetical protein